jgi:hypothetical protein
MPTTACGFPPPSPHLVWPFNVFLSNDEPEFAAEIPFPPSLRTTNARLVDKTEFAVCVGW